MPEPTDPRKPLGAKGERIAEKFLRRKGFKPVRRNLRNKAGEIDLLMWDGDELVIVEVRSMTRVSDVEPNDRVPLSKRRQLVRVSRPLLASLKQPLPVVRFDVCVVVMEPELTVYHYENAFSPDE